jgi:hypothetical protein
MVAALLWWKLRTLFLGYEITKGGLPAFEFSSLIFVVHPTCNFSFSGLQDIELVNRSCDSICNWV